MDEALRRLERSGDATALAVALLRAGEDARALRALEPAVLAGDAAARALMDERFPLSLAKAREASRALSAGITDVVGAYRRVQQAAKSVATVATNVDRDLRAHPRDGVPALLERVHPLTLPRGYEEPFDEPILLVAPLNQLAIHAESACVRCLPHEAAILAGPLDVRVHLARYVQHAPTEACALLAALAAELRGALEREEVAMRHDLAVRACGLGPAPLERCEDAVRAIESAMTDLRAMRDRVLTAMWEVIDALLDALVSFRGPGGHPPEVAAWAARRLPTDIDAVMRKREARRGG